MALPAFKKPKINYVFLAFLAPFLGMCIVMAIRGFIPFGETSMLYSDMYHQYYPFFLAFRNTLRSGDSLLHSWSVGMGMDYLGLISYYLASPLNLLSVLLPEQWLLPYFSLLSPLKLGFAGMFFAIFLKKLFHKNDLSIVMFGSFYALCAWALGYQWNVMWLDTFALLPLVALGAVSLLNHGRFLLYTVSLFLAVFANYYIGFFVCIFIALVFVCYEICRWQGFKKLLCDLGNIAVYSILAIALTAILELPAYAALQNTQSSVNKFPEGFQLNIATENTWDAFHDAMRQVAGNMNGGLIPTFKEGLPNLYCGVITNVLAILFLTCRDVKLRDKFCSLLLLLFFNISFIFRQLDYIWHGFHFTNMIPYRFSFLYSFVMLYMAYRAYLLWNKFRLWQILIAIPPALGIILCVQETKDQVFWIYNGAFLFLYLMVLLYPVLFRPSAKADALQAEQQTTNHQLHCRIGSWILFCVMVAELALNLANFGAEFTGTIVTNYPRGTENTKTVLQHMDQREKDSLFFRAEATHSQTLNDGALNGYNGISTFTSSANVNVTRFMKALGYGAKETYNRYCFEESSPVSNLFLNVKYMLERQGRVEENPYFDDVYAQGDVHLLENNAYLPLGFLADNDLVNTNFNTGLNTFDFQNRLFRSATGLQENVWTYFSGGQLKITGYGAQLSYVSSGGYCSYTTNAGGNGTVVYRYTADRDGFVCISLSLPKKNKYSFHKNGATLYSETYSIPQSLSISQVAKGDILEVHLVCNAGEQGTMTLRAAILDEAVFREGFERLNASTLELTHFDNTTVEGTIQCNRDGVLYTSIPQDGNWYVTVDGKPAQTVLIGEAMTGVLLSEGEHSVCFTYRNSAFSLGWKISLGALAIFILLYFKHYKPHLKWKKRK